MSASAWFQCIAIALIVSLSCFREIKFLTVCCYSGQNWPNFLREENIDLLKKVFIMICMLSNTHSFNYRRLSFLKIFLVYCVLYFCQFDFFENYRYLILLSLEEMHHTLFKSAKQKRLTEGMRDLDKPIITSTDPLWDNKEVSKKIKYFLIKPCFPG